MNKPIFTITAGRSGTRWLASVLNFVDNVVAKHEPPPDFANMMRWGQENPSVRLDWLKFEKIPTIQKYSEVIRMDYTFTGTKWSKDLADPTYIETSHLFCMGFVEPLMGLLPFDVIILRRDKSLIAQSLYAIGEIPGKWYTSRKYYLAPGDISVVGLPFGAWTDYQICYWYVLEIERRQQAYAKMLRNWGARVEETTLESLQTQSRFDWFLSAFNLPPLSGDKAEMFRDFAGRKINDKSEIKAIRGQPLVENCLEQEQELEELYWRKVKEEL